MHLQSCCFGYQTYCFLDILIAVASRDLKVPLIRIKQCSLTSPHALCDSILLSDNDTLPVPFPFLIFREPARVRVSVRVKGALRKK